jgi:hypothetical protein
MAQRENLHRILPTKEFLMDAEKRIFQFGGSYTSIYIDGKLIAEGGRNPFKRLDLIPIDFKDKTIIDLGSNCGGMLFSIADKIKQGYGYEVNPEAIDNANRIKKEFKIDNLTFFLQDLENTEEISFPGVDIVFMLSISRWVRNWKDLIKKINPKILIFEGHGKSHEVEDQTNFINEYFLKVDHLSTFREQRLRYLYLCKNNGNMD